MFLVPLALWLRPRVRCQVRRASELTDAIRAYTVEGSTRALRRAEASQGGSTMQILERSPALVLNSDYQPLSFMPLSVWSWQEAIKAVFMDRVVVVEEYGTVVRSANCVMPVPSVIALRTYQKRQHQYPHFTRRNVYIRDMFTCQYCQGKFRPSQLTYDHVTARSRGGATDWNNVVTACNSCNNKKGHLDLDSYLKKTNSKLLKKPYTPSHAELVQKARRLPLYRQYHSSWGAYVGNAFADDHD